MSCIRVFIDRMLEDKRQVLGMTLAVCAAIIMGMYPIAANIVYLHGGNAAFVILLTTFCRFASMTSFSLVKRRRLFEKGQINRWVVVAGICQGISVTAVFGALQYIPAALVIIIVYFNVLVVFLLMVSAKKEYLTWASISGVFVCLLGLFLVLDIFGLLFTSDEYAYSIKGIFIASISTVAVSAYSFIYSTQMSKRHPIVVGAEGFFFALLFQIFILCFFQIPNLPNDLIGWFFAAVSAICMAAGSFLIFYGYSLIGAYRFGMVIKLEPFFGAIYAAILLGQFLTPIQYLGGVLIVGSLISLSVTKRRSA